MCACRAASSSFSFVCASLRYWTSFASRSLTSAILLSSLIAGEQSAYPSDSGENGCSESPPGGGGEPRWAGTLGGLAYRGLRLQPHRSGRERLHAQVAPGEALAHQRGQAEGDRGGDLDRLQDDAVGQGIRSRDAEALVEDADDRELEDADVRRRRRHDRGHVAREQARGGRADRDPMVETE